jgi:hypothetical protein
MQVELAFDVLKDNKRCYDNILSECGISDPLQIYSGWLDEHDHGMQFWSPFFKNTRPLAPPSFPISLDLSHRQELSEILDFPTSKLIKSVELITRIHL